ncbi:MAG: hypothetical protein WBE58_23685, partial [Verrucomicrobiales bacterium]
KIALSFALWLSMTAAQTMAADDSRLMSMSFFDAVLSGDASGMDSKDAFMPWMPNPTIAKRWQEFSETGTLRPIEPKLSAPGVTVTQGFNGKTHLTWRIIPEISGGLRALRIYRDEKVWKERGLKPGDLLATSSHSAPEILRGYGISDDSPRTSHLLGHLPRCRR